MTASLRNRFIFLSCLFFSLAMHIVCIYFLCSFQFQRQYNPAALFWLSSSDPHLLQQDEPDKETVLQDVFEHIVVAPSSLQTPYDLPLPISSSLLPPKLESIDSSSLIQKRSLSFPVEETSLTTSLCMPKLDVEPPLASPIAQIDPLANKKIEIDPIIRTTIDLKLIPEISEVFIDEEQLSLPKKTTRATAFKQDLEPILDTVSIGLAIQEFPLLSDPNQMDQIAAQIDNPAPLLAKEVPQMKRHSLPKTHFVSPLKNYSFPSFAITNDWNHLFETHVSYTPQEKGYIFSVEISPRRDLSHYRLKQNICFILDRSSSVPRHRFAVFKRAVLKALGSMQEGDSFNIFIIDKKVTCLNFSALEISKKNIRRAEEFLEQQTFGKKASSSDIYKSLVSLLLSLSEQKEVCNAILLTAGKNTFNSNFQQKTVKQWIQNKQGHVTLHTAAVGRENDLTFFNLMSNSSGGRLVYSDTHASFPRKLAKLVLDLRDPLMTHISLSAKPLQQTSQIDLDPSTQSVLYQGIPYTITGYIEDPCSFELSIQGKQNLQWIAIKKKISFEDAQTDVSLDKQWKMTKSHALFIQEGKRDLLSDAEKILKSRFKVAFE